MQRFFYLILLICFGTSVQAQFKVKVVITQKPEQHKNEQIYLTGAFNKWLPGDSLFKLKSENANSESFIINNVKAGLLEFKYTRGNWPSLESTKDGRLEAPRKAIITKDTTIYTAIEGWRDDFPSSTASKNVYLLSNDFYIPQLGVSRKIWVYLPKDYSTSNKKYPVLYMHDGQDLFDEATSQGRIGPLEWGVDETIDDADKKCIVIAISHDDDKVKRIQEYFYYDNDESKNVEGKKYIDFIVNTLKPYVDKHYRTKADKDNTYMAGSSMGGLITLYAGLNYPHVFGSLGILSPSIWQDYGNINKEITKKINNKALQKQRYFFYGGGNENRAKPDGSFVRMNDDVLKTVEQLKASKAEIKVLIDPEGRHGAWYWRSAFKDFYKWLTIKNKY